MRYNLVLWSQATGELVLDTWHDCVTPEQGIKYIDKNLGRQGMRGFIVDWSAVPPQVIVEIQHGQVKDYRKEPSKERTP